MNITIFGMGYVGCVTGACLARLSHHVVGVDLNPVKVDMIRAGKSPIVEPGLDALMAEVAGKGLLTATSDALQAVRSADLIMVSVGTPSQSNGRLELDFVRRVCAEIGHAMKDGGRYCTVVVRSTVLPGTVEETVIPVLEQTSGLRAGKDFGVCMNPEFLREGCSIEDFFRPPKTVIGQLDVRSGEALADIYGNIDAPMVRTTLRVAEMVKYSDNIFHALKVTFANELGGFCKQVGIDSHAVMDIFCLDTKLNLSPYYLKPGFAFGGSCLPKDLRALMSEGKMRDVEMPMLNTILHSNRQQILRVIQRLQRYKGQSLGFLGLSFKGGTDDLRESPIVEVIEAMIGKGFEVSIFDRHVSLARLMGANKEYIEKEIPHISRLLRQSAEEVVRQSGIVVVANRDAGFPVALKCMTSGQTVLDLVRICGPCDVAPATYEGICW